MNVDRTFHSKRDRWAAVMFWVIVLSLWSSGSWVWVAGASLGEFIAADIGGFLAGCVVLWFWYSTRYRVTTTSLHLYSGPFHSEIPLRKIRAVITSRKGWGMSYALSLRSIQIDVEGSEMGYQISPENWEEFMALIAERCGWLRWEGRDLVRQGSGSSR